jgi:hypothetical protein
MPISGNQLNRESYEEASRRAAQQPVSFNPGERSRYVKSMVALTLELKQQGLTVPELKARVPEFAEQYQHLFEMITDPSGFDRRNLEIMLSMLDHMQKGNLTQHDASVIVGKRLFEKYGKTRTDTS